MATVQIIGVAPSASLVPPDTGGAERWCFNNPRMYRVRCPQALTTWTRWVNVHSREHMCRRYPDGFAWYQRQTKPILLQEAYADVPASQAFPSHELINHFQTRFFTSSAAWLIALALYQRPTAIELWGVSPDRDYEHQKPCLAWWVWQARVLGVPVNFFPHIDLGPPGRAEYTGPLYGFETVHI